MFSLSSLERLRFVDIVFVDAHACVADRGEKFESVGGMTRSVIASLSSCNVKDLANLLTRVSMWF